MAQFQPISRRSKSGVHFVIRSPEPRDAEGVLTLAKAVAAEGEYQVSEADEFTMTLDQERDWITQINRSEGDLALVADVDGRVVGFLDFHCNGRRRRLAHTGAFGMSVLKEFRDQKIGTALVDTLLEWAARSAHVEKVSLAVLATNERAIRVYRNLEFVEEGRRVQEVKMAPGKYVDDVLMYRWVK